MSNNSSRTMRFLQQENVRLQEENQVLKEQVSALQRYVHALQQLQETVHRFTPEQDILSLLDETMYCAMMLLDTADGSLMLVDDESNELVFVLVHGAVRETLPGYRFDQRKGIAGWVAENKQPAVVNDVRADPRFISEVDEYFSFHTQSLVAVPLIARNRVYGVIEMVNKQGGENFTDEDVSLLLIAATLCASALDYAASGAPEG
ncbi:MAG: GAF domain-containing protein [Anaerolineae bacterium]|nr:GAF domain-containing protein [Anaerolineae bacterium]